MKLVKLILLLMILSVNFCYAQEIKHFPGFEKDDRILFLAPHPDDETIATGGIIQQAVKQGLPVKIVYLTNGDNNQLAFIVYEKRIVFRKNSFVFMGETRRKEAIKAMGLLGVNSKDLIFLGYPDFGTMHIFTKYWGDGDSFKSMLTRVKNVPYKECFSYRAPYRGESILIDLKTILEEFGPTKIFVSSPNDSNVDHRAFYLFLQVALWDMKGQIKSPEVYPYLVHLVSWPKLRGYRPNLELLPPKRLQAANAKWFRYDLTQRQIENKKSAISCYKSQIEYNPPYLYTFARKNELLSVYPDIVIKEQKGKLNWLAGEEEAAGSSLTVNEEEESVETLAYLVEDNILYIKAKLNKLLSVNMGVNVFLFGYSKDTPFDKMPKIRIRIGFRGNTIIYDKRNIISLPGVEVVSRGKELNIKFPLSGLSSPEYILSCVMASNKGLPSYETAWRVLKLK